MSTVSLGMFEARSVNAKEHEQTRTIQIGSNPHAKRRMYVITGLPSWELALSQHIAFATPDKLLPSHIVHRFAIKSGTDASKAIISHME